MLAPEKGAVWSINYKEQKNKVPPGGVKVPAEFPVACG